ncbi:hypothetical protein ACWFRJ_14985 [Streptomyces sp. NPDC055239]
MPHVRHDGVLPLAEQLGGHLSGVEARFAHGLVDLARRLSA